MSGNSGRGIALCEESFLRGVPDIGAVGWEVVVTRPCQSTMRGRQRRSVRAGDEDEEEEARRWDTGMSKRTEGEGYEEEKY